MAAGSAAARGEERFLSTTVPWRRGVIVIPRLAAPSIEGPVGASEKRISAARNSDCISSMAKLAPMHLRRPAPKGSQVYVPGGCSMKRSGRKL
jgi:hypothetical protein